jgi:hypothetical protein
MEIVQKVLFSLLFTFFWIHGFSQDTKNKNAYFGLEYKPIFPQHYIGNSSTLLVNTKISSEFKQEIGLSIGAIVRVSLNKNISIESGIHEVNRKYTVLFQSLDSSKTASKSLSFLSYDIPISTIFFVKLTNKIFMNVALGPSFVFNPSNVANQVIADNYAVFKSEGRRNSFFGIEMNTHLGWEYRSEKSGIIYFGMAGRIPFAPIYKIATVYETPTSKEVIVGQLNGTYVSLDLRYYFPLLKVKGEQFVNGPIEQ